MASNGVCASAGSGKVLSTGIDDELFNLERAVACLYFIAQDSLNAASGEDSVCSDRRSKALFYLTERLEEHVQKSRG